MGSGAAAGAARAPGKHADQVQALFDSKAAAWPAKYAADGPLAGRLVQLADVVQDLVPAGCEMLDLGCGSGELARHLAACGYRVTGCDISARMLDQAAAADQARAVRWVQLPVGWRELPVEAGSLDAVIASSLLEYVTDPAGVLAACARVLRPGGVLLCTVPAVAHLVRWLEWPFWLTAQIPVVGEVVSTGNRAAQYLAYLRTSRQRHRVRWWQAAGRVVGLEPGPGRRAGSDPLCLLIFTKPDAARQSVNTTEAV